MGYRYYLGEINKKDYNKIKNLSYKSILNKFGENLESEDAYVSVEDIVSNKLYELGKDVNYNHLKKFMIPFLKNKKTQMKFSDYDFWIVDQEFLRGIIEDYRKGVLDFYKKQHLKLNEIYDLALKDSNALSEKVKKDLAEMTIHLKRRAGDWDNDWGLIYNIEDPDTITDSWSFEYAIFQLTYIYKTFDWKSNHLVFYAW